MWCVTNQSNLLTLVDTVFNYCRLLLETNEVTIARAARTVCVDMNEDVLIASIQNEVEMSQHMADMMASTKSMRRRKQATFDLTYRRRGAKAKQSLCSYTPAAPCQSNWGDIFDDMLNEIRDKGSSAQAAQSLRCSTCQQAVKCDEGSVYDNCDGIGLVNGSTNTPFQSELTKSPVESRNVEDIIRSPWLASSVSDYVMDKQSYDLFDGQFFERDVSVLPSQMADSEVLNGACSCTEPHADTADDDKSDSLSVAHSDAEAFWEENWSDTPVETVVVVPSPCDACSSACDDVSGALRPGIKPTLCYMNQKCSSFDASGSSDALASHSTPMAVNGQSSSTKEVPESLRNIAFRRPDLASITLPLSPIRKTDSSKLVSRVALFNSYGFKKKTSWRY